MGDTLQIHYTVSKTGAHKVTVEDFLLLLILFYKGKGKVRTSPVDDELYMWHGLQEPCGARCTSALNLNKKERKKASGTDSEDFREYFILFYF